MLSHEIARSSLLTLIAIATPGLSAQSPAILSVRDITLGIPSANNRFDLVPGHRTMFSTTGDPGEATAFLVSATMPNNPPVIGGVELAVDPNNFAAIAPAFVNARGVTSFAFTVPYNFAIGTRLCTQTLLVDPRTLGVRLSNGVVLRVDGEPLRTIAMGTLSGHPLGQVPQGGALLIVDPAAWSAFWQQHRSVTTGPSLPPGIDFGRDAVVAVFAGWRPTGGHSLRIDEVRQIAVGGQLGLRVEGRQTSPGPGCAVLQVITQPFHLVTIPRAAVNGAILEVSMPNAVLRCR